MLVKSRCLGRSSSPCIGKLQSGIYFFSVTFTFFINQNNYHHEHTNRKSQIYSYTALLVALSFSLVTMTGCKENSPVAPEPTDGIQPKSAMKDGDDQVSMDFIVQFRNMIQRGQAEMPAKIDEFIRRFQSERPESVRPAERPNVKLFTNEGARLDNTKLISRTIPKMSQPIGLMNGNSTHQQQSETVTTPQLWRYFLLGTLAAYTVPTYVGFTNSWRNDVWIEVASQAFSLPNYFPAAIDEIAVSYDVWVDGFYIGGEEKISSNSSIAFESGVIQDDPMYLNIYGAQSNHRFKVEGIDIQFPPQTGFLLN